MCGTGGGIRSGCLRGMRRNAARMRSPMRPRRRLCWPRTLAEGGQSCLRGRKQRMPSTNEKRKRRRAPRERDGRPRGRSAGPGRTRAPLRAEDEVCAMERGQGHGPNVQVNRRAQRVRLNLVLGRSRALSSCALRLRALSLRCVDSPTHEHLSNLTGLVENDQSLDRILKENSVFADNDMNARGVRNVGVRSSNEPGTVAKP